MYTINTSRNSTQKCEKCSNYFIEYVGTQPWCTSCQKPLNCIQQQVKIVPKMYQSNTKEKPNSAQQKIVKYISEFANKYGCLSDPQQINYMYLQVIQIRDKKGKSTKNYRQNTAVIVYHHFKQMHNLPLKQFCRKNQVQLKSFNKSYFVYQKLLKQNQVLTNETEPKQESNEKIQDIYNKQSYFSQVKKQPETLQKIEHISGDVYQCELEGQNSLTKIQTMQYNANTIQTKMFNQKLIFQEVSKFIQVIFQHFFPSSLYKQKQSILIKQLSSRLIQLYSLLKLLLSSSAFEKQYSIYSITESNFYLYLFFVVLKKISLSISQLKYKKTIEKALGVNIKTKILQDLTRIIQENQETMSYFGQDGLFIENSGTTGGKVRVSNVNFKSEQCKYESDQCKYESEQ